MGVAEGATRRAAEPRAFGAASFGATATRSFLVIHVNRGVHGNNLPHVTSQLSCENAAFSQVIITVIVSSLSGSRSVYCTDGKNYGMIRVMEVIDSAHVRTARAVLAWTQLELAEASGLSKSTVADFERGSRTLAPNSAQAIRAAFEAHGVEFADDGGIRFDGRIGSVIATPGVPLAWITSKDLANWGERRDGPAGFPIFLAMLIYAERGPSARMRFPAEESIGTPGWDGRCEVDGESRFIPDGISVWEFTAQADNITTKANKDYKKRTSDPLDEVPAETTFVFVTLQRWRGKSAWVANKRAECKWRDVRAYDADDLVHWLEMAPAVAIYLSRRMNQRSALLRDLDEVWDEWAKATRQPLTPGLLTAGRDVEASRTLRWLYGTPALLEMQAESTDEAKAFLYASMAPLSPEHRLPIVSRCVVAGSEDEARRLVGIGAKLVVVLTEAGAGLAAQLIDDGHHVFNAYGPEAVTVPSVVRLGALSMNDVLYELEEKMGLSEQDAQRLAVAARNGGSVSSLRRLLHVSQPRIPSWAAGEPAAVLVASMLAGAWDETVMADRDAVASLCSMTYDALEPILASKVIAMDAPIRHTPPLWRVTSIRDAWNLLAPHLTNAHIARFASVFQQTLGVASPDVELPASERWRSTLESDGTCASRHLRRGLVDVLTAMQVIPNQAKNVSELRARADAMVRELFQTADDRVWWSLRREFRHLAEASPSEFIRAIEDALDNPDAPLARLFNREPGLMGRTDYLAELLQALEILAWSPEFIGSVACILCDLAALDETIRGTTRPEQTLRQILLTWLPQTRATADQRLEVVETILQRDPEIGWRLLLALAPHLGDASSSSSLPLWHDFSSSELEVLTPGIQARSYEAIGTLLLENVGSRAARWRTLLPLWSAFDVAWRDRAVRQLSSDVSRFSDDEESKDLCEELRTLIRRHRGFATAQWAMGEVDLVKLDAVFLKMQPVSPTERNAWLFDRHDTYISDPLVDSTKIELDARAAAVEDIFESLGLGPLLAFAQSVRLPYAFGEALIASALPEEMKKQALTFALSCDEPELLSTGMLGGLSQARGKEWVKEHLTNAIATRAPAREIVRLAWALPAEDETFRAINEAELSVLDDYWSRIAPYAIARAGDTSLVINNLVRVGRAYQAVIFLGLKVDEGQVSSAEIIGLLRHTLENNVVAANSNGNDAVMLSHYVARLFQHLDRDDTLEPADIAMLEWSYFTILESSERPPHRIHALLSRSPRFFVLLLKSIFKPSSESGIVDEVVEDEEQALRIAEHAYRVLAEWSVVPGMRADGAIDEIELTAWVHEARQLSKEIGRGRICDDRIGDILAADAYTTTGPWPPAAICKVVEACRSRPLELGLEVGVANRRGVTTRNAGDGGDQERLLAASFSQRANDVAFKYPRVKALLGRIANNYLREAERHDSMSASFR